MPRLNRAFVLGTILTFGLAPATAAAGVLAAASVDQPSVDEVLASSIRAVGGKPAVDAITSIRSVWEIDVDGMKITSDTSWSRAGGRLARMVTPMGEMEVGTDGTLAWQKTPFGYSLMEGDDAEQVDSQANMYMMVLEPERLAKDESKSIEVAGKEAFAGKECWRLRYVSKDDQPGDVFFDAASGLLMGMRQVEASPEGEQTATILFEDWKDEAGVKFFRTMRIDAQGAAGAQKVVLSAKSVELNTVAAGAFVAPDEVKKLAEAAKNAAPSAGGIALADLTPDQQTQAKEMVDGLKQAGAAGRSAMASLEQAAKHAPESDRKMYQYVVQELKKHFAALEGGK